MNPPAHKELCFFSRFKRHLQHHRLSPASSWPLYVSAFEGAAALAARKRQLDPNGAGAAAAMAQRRRQLDPGQSRRRFGGQRVSWAAADGAQLATSGRRLSSLPHCEAARRQSFEACPFYLGEVHSAAAIRAVFPRLRIIAVLRNPRDRTVSAFNDYVRVGRIRGRNASAAGMEAVVAEKVRDV